MHTSPTGRSWSGTVEYGPGTLYAPKNLDELQSLVAGSSRIRALGTRHSFSEIGATGGDLVTLADLPPTIEIDTAARTVRVAAGVRYGELVTALWDAGLALGNMGSLPHISVAGASATGTHGSGDTNQALPASVREVELVTADGDLVTVRRPDAAGGSESSESDWGGMVLALGLLGVATHLTLDVVPAFRVRQAVYLDMPAASMDAADLDAALGGAYSVSLFHHWDGHVAQAWVKQKVAGEDVGSNSADGAGADAAGPMPETWCGARRADGPVHPLPGMPADFCTDQTGTPGPYFERLPHFRLEFTPSSGEEIQSEYFVPRDRISQALAAVMPLGDRIRPLLHASEVRTVAADELWLSPASGRDSACVHFTWKSWCEDEVVALLPEIEAALAPLSPRPHWGQAAHHGSRGGAGTVPAPGRLPGAARTDGSGARLHQSLHRAPARDLSGRHRCISRIPTPFATTDESRRKDTCHDHSPSPPAPHARRWAGTAGTVSAPPSPRTRYSPTPGSWPSTSRATAGDTVVVDIDWSDPTAKSHGYNDGAPLVMDEYGRLQPDPGRFPSSADGTGFTQLARQVHELGLRFGIHVMRGIPKLAVERNTPVLGADGAAAGNCEAGEDDPTAVHARDVADPSNACEWNPDMVGLDHTVPGAGAYYDSVLGMYAGWGVDFLKVDDMLWPYQAAEIEAFAGAIDRCGRDIDLSLSPGRDLSLTRLPHLREHATMWRISDDLWDRWEDVEANFARFARWAPHSGPEGWADGDMLPLGHVGIRARAGARTAAPASPPDEQRTLMTLWVIARSPLMVGGDLPTSDEQTISLLTNPDVLAVHASSHGAREVFREDPLILWTAEGGQGTGAQDGHDQDLAGQEGEDGGVQYVAAFNVGGTDLPVSLDAQNVGLPADLAARAGRGGELRELWSGHVLEPRAVTTQSDQARGVAPGSSAIDLVLPAHGAALLRWTPARRTLTRTRRPLRDDGAMTPTPPVRTLLDETRTLTLEDQSADRFPGFAFTVPPGTRSVTASLEVTGEDGAPSGVIDLGCEGAGGWRGWSGGARRTFTIADDDATPGYLPGPLEQGEWHVVLGIHALPAGSATVRVAVRSPATLAVDHGPHPAPVVRSIRGSDRELPAPEGMRWYAGDTHCHDLHSDGSLSLWEVANQAVTSGLDFLCVTDHNTTSHHARLPEVAAAPRHHARPRPGGHHASGTCERVRGHRVRGLPGRRRLLGADRGRTGWTVVGQPPRLR
jgi:alpha-galactosidase